MTSVIVFFCPVVHVTWHPKHREQLFGAEHRPEDLSAKTSFFPSTVGLDSLRFPLTRCDPGVPLR